MTELKGKIKINGSINFTCCESVPNIYIDETQLHSFVKDMTKLTEPMDDNDYCTNEGIYQWNIEYCTSGKPFVENSFEECAAQKQTDMLYSEEVTGCYSTWTCGSGDYNFVLDEKGHSLLGELASFEGQYVWISFGEQQIIENSEKPTRF